MKKKILKVFASLTISALVSTNVSACGIEYVRLSKDISKWDIGTIFSNSALLQAIDDSKIIDLKDSLNSFYQPCFDSPRTNINDLKKLHKEKLPNVYFLINERDGTLKYDVYVPTLPIIYQAIINYEAHTKKNDKGLNTYEKIKDNISFKYPKKLDNMNQIYVKNEFRETIEKDGVIEQNQIYQEKLNNDKWLLTKIFDSSNGTPGYVSVSSLIELNIKKNEESEYFGSLVNKLFFVTISWL